LEYLTEIGIIIVFLTLYFNKTINKYHWQVLMRFNIYTSYW